jgi:hypothetical protein
LHTKWTITKTKPVDNKLEARVREWFSGEPLEQRGFFVWGQGKDNGKEGEVFVERMECLLDVERKNELDENVSPLSLPVIPALRYPNDHDNLPFRFPFP